ncbi:MAG TPA: hypothetical protein VFY10_08200 [Dehalococcoidia bacterium]|nr:hypothetical protein [Dehalococcoidia bacterium]
MTNQPPPQRVSPIHSPDAYASPARPPESAGAPAQDAYRQTRFVLGTDLDLFADTMSLQLALVKDAYPSQHRTHSLAALMALWSRSYSYLGDGVLLATRGSYTSTLPLVRAAAESIAAQEGLRAGEMEMHHEWLANTLQPNEQFKAFEFHLGHYFAGGVLHGDPVLRSVYRPAAELARPAFGASLLQVAPESNNIRVAIAFADQSFHLGWAELTLGWLLALAGRQLRVIVDAEGIFPVSPERRTAYEALQKQIDASLARSDRCRIEEIEDRGDRRLLVHNFRRASSGAPKKILL